jgi:hypothetical protein
LYNTFFGYQAGFSNSSGSNNVYMGYQAGYAATVDNNNIFIGVKAGYKNEGPTGWFGDDNVFIGDNAGYENIEGHDNVYVGNNAGKANTQFYNVAIGSDAGSSSTGAFNTFLGNSAGQSSTGAGNTYLGMAAGRYNTTGSSNVYVGSRAGFWNTSGSNNVVIGYGAAELASGQSLGDNNIIIGFDAGDAQAGVSNKLIIENSSSTSPLIYGDFSNDLLKLNGNLGINANPSSAYGLYADNDQTAGSNYGVYATGGYMGLRASAYGDGSGTTYGTYGSASGASSNRGVYGYGYGGTTAYGVYGYAYGASTNWAGYFSGNIYCGGTFSYSDARLKKNINTISSATEKLAKIRGVYFEWNTEAIENMEKVKDAKHVDENESSIEEKTSELTQQYPKGQQVGVIAQEVEEIMPEAVLTDTDGTKLVDYTKLVPLLIQAINEQQQQIQQQGDQIEKLKADIIKSSGNE